MIFSCKTSIQPHRTSVPTKPGPFFSFRKINTNHAFIQQLQKTGQNLYVVHETIETLEEASYQEISEADGNFMAQLYIKFCVKVWFQAQDSALPHPLHILKPGNTFMFH